METKFTKETAAHFCCKNGHVDILNSIIKLNIEAVTKLDDEGNTLYHSLCYVRNILINLIELCY